MSSRPSAPALIAAAIALGGAALAAQEPAPSLESLLAAAGRYVEQYERSFSAVVSREQYQQRSRTGSEYQTREIRSDVALVTSSDATVVMFRDVYEVNGQAVRDRTDRLAELFMKPSATVGTQAKAIAEESARYNLGPIHHTLNTPTQALIVLRPRFQARSTFRLRGRPTIAGTRTQEIGFTETSKPRIVATQDDAAAFGRFWVEPTSGAVVRSEFGIRSAGGSALILVTYALQPALALWVPVSMSESYEAPDAGMTTGGRMTSNRLPSSARSIVESQATYSNFRRFSVDSSVIIR
jgi:hypothetical protein